MRRIVTIVLTLVIVLISLLYPLNENASAALGDIRVIDITDRSVEIQWNQTTLIDPQDFDKYVVWRAKGCVGFLDWKPVYETTNINLTIWEDSSDLEANTTYSYQVKAYMINQSSAIESSNVLCVQTKEHNIFWSIGLGSIILGIIIMVIAILLSFQGLPARHIILFGLILLVIGIMLVNPLGG